MSPARLLCAVVNDACGFVRRQKLQDREKRPPELSEPHIRRRQRRRQRDPSVTDSQIKNRRAAISGNSRNCSKCGPESAGVGVWCRLVHISGVEGAPVDRSTHYDRRRHTRTFCPLVGRTGGQRIQSGGSTGNWAAVQRDERIKLITARLRRTDGRRQLQCRCLASTCGSKQRQRQLFFFAGWMQCCVRSRLWCEQQTEYCRTA